jgi:ribosomal protein L11 methyltransferase
LARADIDAVDIDPGGCVESTVPMPQANDVKLNAGLPDKAQGQYQTVLANIPGHAAQGAGAAAVCPWRRAARWCWPGILDRQEAELKQAYAPHCRLEVADTEDGWILMTARL